MSGSMLDEDTRRAVDSGRATLGAMISAAQRKLQKVFIVSLIGLVGTIIFMRRMGWAMLKGVMTARMEPHIADQANVIVRTPFDVILLQFKLGLGVSLLIAIPMILYYGREPLRRRGVLPSVALARWKAAGLGVLAAALFATGVAYAYFIFFPVAFEFLTEYTLNTGFDAEYDLIKWTQFILLLTLSFGLAAELPLVMSAFSYAEILPYEFWRDNWRYAAMGIFLFGALFSPPDPFTQIMWAVPLLVLYGFSLYLAKFVTAAHRSGSAHVRRKVRANWFRIAVPFTVATGAVYLLLAVGGLARLNELLAWTGYRLTVEGFLSLSGDARYAAVALLWGALVAFPVLVYYAWPELEPRERPRDPTAIDLDELDAAGVRAAPVEAFVALSEEEAVDHARRAMDDGDDEKAQAVLDRFDEAEELDEEAAADGATAEAAAAESSGAADAAKGATADVVDAFTEEETTEEDIGGYYYDMAFILESLTSRSFRVVAVFGLSVMLTFFGLYQGGFKLIRNDFLSRLPAEVVEEQVKIVALHPVEALLFEVKMSLIVGVLVTLPAILYYAWPAIERRFQGITHDYSTPAPGDAVAARWNRVAAVFVLFAGLGYAALAGESVPAPDGPVSVLGTTLTAETLLYLAAGGVGLAGAVAAAGYYAWPSLRERWMEESKRGAFLLWAGTLLFGLVVGSLLGYTFVAPTVITYLVNDAIQAGMEISYTINNFFWLIFLTTAGIGLLADIPMTMWLFHRAGIVSYETMRERWRGVVFVVFVAAAFFTSHSIITMVVFGIPISLVYWFGLAGLWVGTFPSRRRAEEPEPGAD